MRDLDETDRKILQLLMKDGRRAYTEIADEVNLSSATISDRIARLRNLGIVRRFTVEIDRSMLTESNAVLIDIQAKPGAADEIQQELSTVDAVEHVFQTLSSRVLAQARMNTMEVQELLSDTLDASWIQAYDVELVVNSDWKPQLGGGELSIDCTVCGNQVRSDGVSVAINEQVYYVCCPSCESKLQEEYETRRQAADEST